MEIGKGEGTSIPTGIDTIQHYVNGPNPRPDSDSRIDAEFANDVLVALSALENDLYRTRVVDARTYSTFSQAVTAAIGKTLLICSSVTLDENTTIDSSTSVLFLKPGVINGNGKTLNISNIPDNPIHQIFSGFIAGQVTGLKEINPKWFGGLNNTITVLSTNTAHIILDYVDTLTASLTIPSTCSVEFYRTGNITKGSATSLSIGTIVGNPMHQIFSGFAAGEVVFGFGSINELNVKWFGAKGDGVTDDASAIQLAFDTVEVSERGGTIYFPRGYYRITGQLSITAVVGAVIVGAGRGDANTDATNKRGTAIYYDGAVSTTDAMLLALNTTELSVRDIGFHANNKTAFGIQVRGIADNDSIRMTTLYDLSITGATNAGLLIGSSDYVTPPSYDIAPVNIYNSHITGNKNGVIINSTNAYNVNFYGCIFGQGAVTPKQTYHVRNYRGHSIAFFGGNCGLTDVAGPGYMFCSGSGSTLDAVSFNNFYSENGALVYIDTATDTCHLTMDNVWCNDSTNSAGTFPNAIACYGSVRAVLSGVNIDCRNIIFPNEVVLLNVNVNYLSGQDWRVIGPPDYRYGKINSVTQDSGDRLGIKIIGGNLEMGSSGANSKIGLFGASPIVQPTANADTSGVSLGNLEIEVNQLKQLLRDIGLMAT